MPSGHAYAKAVRTVKTCVGTDFCRFGLGDAIGVGIELERAMEGLYTPHKVKSAVTGCPRNCAEAYVKDIGLVAVEGGWELYVGGAAGATRAQGRPARHGRDLATRRSGSRSPSSSTTASTAEYLERTYALPRAGRHRGGARGRAGRHRTRCSSATGSPRPRPTPTRGASATTPSTPSSSRSSTPMTADRARADAGRCVGRVDGHPAARGPQHRRRRPADRGLPHCPTASRAIDAHCPHAGGPLADGIVADSLRHLPAARPALRPRDRARRCNGPRRVAVHEVRRRASDEICGCGLPDGHAPPARTAGSAAGWSPRSTAGGSRPSRGDPLHPVNRGATCRKPLRLPEAVHAPDRATTPLWRASARRALARRRRGATVDLAPSARQAAAASRPGGDRVLHLRPAADRGLLRGQQARQGLPRHQQRRLELAPVHVERGRRLHGRARLRRPAAVLRRHRRGRRASSWSAPTPRPATRSCGTRIRAARRGRVPDRRRPAPDADRRARRPAPAGPARHRPAAAERDAPRARARRPARPDVPRAPHEGAEEALDGRGRVAARARRGGRAACRPRTSSRRRARFGSTQAGDGAVVDGRQPVDRRDAEEPRAQQPLPGDRQHRPARDRAAVADRASRTRWAGARPAGSRGLLPGYRKVTDAEDRAEMRRLWGSPRDRARHRRRRACATELVEALEDGRGEGACGSSPPTRSSRSRDAERFAAALRRAELVVVPGRLPPDRDRRARARRCCPPRSGRRRTGR